MARAGRVPTVRCHARRGGHRAHVREPESPAATALTRRSERSRLAMPQPRPPPTAWSCRATSRSRRAGARPPRSSAARETPAGSSGRSCDPPRRRSRVAALDVASLADLVQPSCDTGPNKPTRHPAEIGRSAYDARAGLHALAAPGCELPPRLLLSAWTRKSGARRCAPASDEGVVRATGEERRAVGGDPARPGRPAVRPSPSSAAYAVLVGWRRALADATAPRVANRASLSEDQVRAAIGGVLFAASLCCVIGAIVRLVRA